MARLHSNLSHIAKLMPVAASRALLQTGADILDLAQQLVRVDTSSLKKSGGVEPQSSTKVHVGFGSEGEYFAGRHPSEYAPYVEYGTSKMAAQPFLLPAFVQNQKTFYTRLMQEVQKIPGVG